MVKFETFAARLGLTATEAGRLELAGRVKLLTDAGFFRAAYDELAACFPGVSAQQAAHAIALLRLCGDHEASIDCFLRLDGRLKRSPPVLLEYLLALALANRFADVRTLLQVFLSGDCASKVNFGKLLTLAQFASNESLGILASHAILGFGKTGNPVWLHHLFEIAKQRRLNAIADTLRAVCRMADARALDPQESLLFASNTAFRNGKFSEQNACLSAVFESYGLVGTELLDPGKPVGVKNLSSAVPAEVEKEGPLVSILLPTFNDADTVGAVCDAVFAQTYRNFELIVIDDASTDRTVEVLRRHCARDARARLVVLDRNGGLFNALNHGLVQSRGEFVTRQDADDWAHPQKLQVLVSALAGKPDAIACETRMVRCSTRSGMESRASGFARPDYSSLIYRRGAVTRELGFYDTVRCSGDAEFRLRIEYRFGRGSIDCLRTLTGVCDWSPDSLTGGGMFDMQGGFPTPIRSAYRRCFQDWHETARLRDDLYLPFPQAARKFAAPPAVLPDAPTADVMRPTSLATAE